MKKIIGFAVFFLGLGMFVGNMLPGNTWAIIIGLSSMCIGYHLFCHD